MTSLTQESGRLVFIGVKPPPSPAFLLCVGSHGRPPQLNRHCHIAAVIGPDADGAPSTPSSATPPISGSPSRSPLQTVGPPVGSIPHSITSFPIVVVRFTRAVVPETPLKEAST